MYRCLLDMQMKHKEKKALLRGGKTAAPVQKQNSVQSSDSSESNAVSKLVNGGGSPKTSSTVSLDSTEGDNVKPTTDDVKVEEKQVVINGGLTSRLDAIRVPDSDNPESFISLRLCVPNHESLTLRVAKCDLVQELHQFLMENEETNHRTCFCLKFQGKVLDFYAEIGAVPELTDNSPVYVVEETYTLRHARIHVHHVRDMLRFVDNFDGFNNQEFALPSFIDTLYELSPDRKRSSQQVDCTPPEYILPGAKMRPMTMLSPVETQCLPICLKVLHMSSYNPPPSYRILKGDLLYVYVLTLEQKAFHITCCPSGFFVNRSTDEVFNPLPTDGNLLCHSLVDLLSQLSPGFKRNFVLIRKKRRHHPYTDRVACPLRNFRWIMPSTNPHLSDYLRAEDNYLQRLGFEDIMPGQVREWNDEVQTCREMPRLAACQRALRSRNLNKVYSDFVDASLRGAVHIVHGNVVSINPQDELRGRMYLWNSIFFSLGFDLKEQYKVIGGDAAAFASAKHDLNGVQAYFNLDPQGLSLLGTCVVDYRGYRVTCQTVIPGVLERDQQSEPCILYGSVDFGVNVFSDEKFCELLSDTARELRILPHKVQSSKGNVELLLSSVESKGIRGNDDRLYLLDVYRFSPADPHFITGALVSDLARQHGYPRSHPHSLAYYRPELVTSFVKAKATKFIELISESLHQPLVKPVGNGCLDDTRYSWIYVPKNSPPSIINNMINCVAAAQKVISGNLERPTIKITELTDHIFHEKKTADEADEVTSGEGVNGDVGKETLAKCEDVEKSSITVLNGADSSEVQIDAWEVALRSATDAVYSYKPTEFDIRFNLDVYSEVCKNVAQPEELLKQKQLLSEVGEFLIKTQIPQFISDVSDHSDVIIDSRTLTAALHDRGISIRYLGLVIGMLGGNAKVDYVKKLCLMEIVSRCAKHHFRGYIMDVDQSCASAALAHFLNCYLTADVAALVSAEAKRKPKKKGRVARAALHRENSADNDWRRLSTASLWQALVSDAKDYYNFSLAYNSMDEFCAVNNVQKVSLLRCVCMMTGIQLKLSNYDFGKASFTEDSVLSLEAVVHRMDIACPDGQELFDAAVRRLETGSVKAGLDKAVEAMGYFCTAYGQIHPTVAKCLKLCAKTNFCVGDYTAALNSQQRAVQIMERWYGIDDANLIPDYILLAVFCFVVGKLSSAFNLLYRSRYLVLMLYGETHPLTMSTDVNIGMLLYSVGEFDLSLEFLQNALTLSKDYYGVDCFKTGLIYHLMALNNTCRADYRMALFNERNAYTIYRIILGENNSRTLASGQRLHDLTDRAVNMQRKMNGISRGSGNSSISDIIPSKAPVPDANSVIEMLTLVNGLQWVLQK